MSQQKWDFAAIEAASSAIQGSVGTTERLLDEGKASLKNLAAAWGGSGAEAYQAVQARWDDTSVELNKSLSDLNTKIIEAKEYMQQTEGGISAKFGG
jgi:early secretory antigenic target protein ESAT-6